MLYYVHFGVNQRLYLGDDGDRLGVIASLEGFEPTTRCLEDKDSEIVVLEEFFRHIAKSIYSLICYVGDLKKPYKDD